MLFTGPTGTGKTSFALACFESPLLIRHADELKLFIAGVHDGLVFDDMTFHHWPIEQVIHLVDLEHDSPIHLRYHNVTIPAGLPRIFTSNLWNPFYETKMEREPQQDAVDRRFSRIEITTSICI